MFMKWVRKLMSSNTNHSAAKRDSSRRLTFDVLEERTMMTTGLTQAYLAPLASSQAAHTVLHAPATPTGLHATATGTTSISISWNSVSGATSYKVDRWDSGTGSWRQISSTGATSYTDSGSQLKPGTTYFYVVAASNAAGTSSFSGYVTAMPRQALPATPTGLRATATGAASIAISWNTASGAGSYRLERWDSGTGSWKQIYLANTTSYIDSGTQLKPGTTYYYMVAAVNGAGDSTFSSYVSATTPRQTGNAAAIAERYTNRTAADLMASGDLPMDKGIDTAHCCANFVSACLEQAGLINHSQHQDAVSNLADMLKNAGWKVADLAHAKRGDVVIIKGNGQSHTEIVDSNDNGKLVLIGSNNPNGGMQRIGTDASNFAKINGGYVLTPPQ